ncbi:hypothetical protein OQJ26_12480 [Legionella sp. PATHC038]|uniref:hypothetical protein n=1 Tax=Legionella sheltonii TaxID=2992041 RepID=UPI002244ECFD|nr:hypothetical protein [Legionella sp. PATHC038]MCW8399609.1 hypothetical protein [Legionella sp. PATHC038]
MFNKIESEKYSTRSSWAKSSEEKQKLILEYQDIYKSSLSEGTVFRIVGLSILETLALPRCNHLWVLPVGYYHSVPPTLTLTSPESSEIQNHGGASRFGAVIVYDEITGGMCFFHFGKNPAYLSHSSAEYNNNKEFFLDTPSAKLSVEILTILNESNTLDKVGGSTLFASFKTHVKEEIIQHAKKLTDQTTINLATFTNLGLECDTVKILSGEHEENTIIGIIPLLPEEKPIILCSGNPLFGPSTHFTEVPALLMQPFTELSTYKSSGRDNEVLHDSGEGAFQKNSNTPHSSLSIFSHSSSHDDVSTSVVDAPGMTFKGF